MLAALLHAIRRSIALKLTLTLVGFVGVTLIVGGIYLNYELERFAVQALEARLVGMRAGETRELRIPPEEAWGERQPGLVRTMAREHLPPDLVLEVGREYVLKTPEGRPLRFSVRALGEQTVEADFNPRGAGEELHATVTVVAVRVPTAAEERRGRV